MSESESWYIRSRGRVLGPFSLQQLERLREGGRIDFSCEVSVDRQTWGGLETIPAFTRKSASGKSASERSRPSATDQEPKASQDKSSKRDSGDFEEYSLQGGGSEAPVWYVSKNGEPSAPCTETEFFEMGGTGQISPTDLVWKEGLPEWIPAAEVDGLIPPQLKANAYAEVLDAISEPVSIAPTHVHFFDHLLEALREVIILPQSATPSSGPIELGRYSMYALMICTLLAVIIPASRGEKDWSVFLWILVPMALTLLAVQYAAVKFSYRCDAVLADTPMQIQSSAPFDCLAVWCLCTGGGLFIVAIGMAVHGQFLNMLGGVSMGLLFLFSSVIALHPERLNIHVTTQAAPLDEGLGLLSILPRVLVRMAPAIFGVGMLSTLVMVIYFGYQLFYRTLRFDEIGTMVSMIYGTGLISALTPIVSYFAFLGCYLILGWLQMMTTAARNLEAFARHSVSPGDAGS